jgi:hypothetical protein
MVGRIPSGRGRGDLRSVNDPDHFENSWVCIPHNEVETMQLVGFRVDAVVPEHRGLFAIRLDW